MVIERRRSKRVNAPFYVRIGYNISDTQKKWEESSAKNVSLNGLAMTTSHVYEKGFILMLMMRIPTQPTLDWVETIGKVVECTRIMDNVNITRIEFTDPGPDVQDAVKKYVDWASKK